MSGEVEALGGAATASLAAQALDPERGRHGAVSALCLNCGAEVDGRFCGQCGQAAHVHRTMSHVVEEFLHGVLHIDTKAWRTLPLLIFRPGTLTRNYVHGQRARYIAPLPLFLFTVFLMFFLFGTLGGLGLNDTEVDFNRQVDLVAAHKALDEAKAGLAKAEADAAQRPANAATTTGLSAMHTAVSVAEQRVKAIEAARRTPDAPVSTVIADLNWKEQLKQAAESGELNVDTGNAKLNARIGKALRNPDLTLYKVQQKAYKLSFLLVPMSLPFLWLLFPFRRDVNMYDHTVFALYSLSFMSLLFILFVLLSAGGLAAGAVGSILLLVPPVHLFVQLKGAYALSWPSALWRTLWLVLFTLVVLSAFILLIIFLGIVD